ncbi:hypothetical protein [Ulvibacter antarcticus]|uniref:Uncharacterized protein n=1 Tax=Ulvibacter antarcticus TaxID=442714 RepID=A0A3L9YF56_9FLAO|nr:hypothetical protein [Ulvibacter antarcticus]RMA56648.1 hypothetical protein BXY75_3351 [Ulvibacter antarcticus]
MKKFLLTILVTCMCVLSYAQDKPKVNSNKEKTTFETGINTSTKGKIDHNAVGDDVKIRKEEDKCVNSGGIFLEFSDGSYKCWNKEMRVSELFIKKENVLKDTLDVYGRKRRCKKDGGYWVVYDGDKGCYFMNEWMVLEPHYY